MKDALVIFGAIGIGLILLQIFEICLAQIISGG
jgi:hypothetical protein